MKILKFGTVKFDPTVEHGDILFEGFDVDLEGAEFDEVTVARQLLAKVFEKCGVRLLNNYNLDEDKVKFENV